MTHADLKLARPFALSVLEARRFYAQDMLYKCLSFSDERWDRSYFNQVLGRLGTDADNIRTKASASKNKKMRSTESQEIKGPKGKHAK